MHHISVSRVMCLTAMARVQQNVCVHENRDAVVCCIHTVGRSMVQVP